MSAHRRRRRRGSPRGKAWGFHGLKPASSTQKTKSASTQGSNQDNGTSSTPTSSNASNGS